MGLYDSVMIKTKCIYCGEILEMEFQTKDGNYHMSIFKVGDVFQESEDNAGKFKFINAIGSCESFTCRLEAAKKSIWERGYYGGFSRSFDAHIYLDKKGKITNKIKIYKLNGHKGIMRGKNWLDKFKEDDGFHNQKRSYEFILDLFNLEDNEEAMEIWFRFRNKINKMCEYFKEELFINDNETLSSIFLSNNIDDLIMDQ